MQNNKRKGLHKYFRQAISADEVMGSHAYGKVARTHRPIPKRRPAATKKSTIAGYQDSMVGSTVQYREKIPVVEKPANEEKPAGSDATVIGNRPKSGSADEAKTSASREDRQHHFIEPPKRGFNRFG